MKHGRPALYKDRHLPIARELLFQEAGRAVETPPRAFMKRAAMIQGRGTNFTLEELDLAERLIARLEEARGSGGRIA